MMKLYPGLMPEKILYEMSYQNIALLNAVIPAINSSKSESSAKYDDKTDANNPDNFKDEPEIEIIRK